MTFSKTRAKLVLAVLGVSLIGMTGRVAYLQTYGRQKTIRSAERQQHVSETTPARRGTLFASDGSPLALTVQAMSLYVDPKFMIQQYQAPDEKGVLRDLDKDLKKLAEFIDKDASDLIDLIGSKADSRYLRIAGAEKLDDRTCQEIRKLDVPGVGLEPVADRHYPMGSLAAHVLGSVGKEGVGLEGIELKYQKELAGKNGWKRIEKDARRRPIAIDADDFVPPEHGKHMVLTIDANIQTMAEQELKNACEHVRAQRGEVVVLDPNTGEVLALANWPYFNPQNLGDTPPDVRRNRTLTDPYEPGSTLKPFIMGPALAWKFTRPEERWTIAGPYVAPYGKGRRVSDVHYYGTLNSWDVLVKSSNIGMSLLAARMTNPNLHKALANFRFGQRTDIELPGEDQGMLNPLRKWTRYSTESVAQGYEVMVTPMQLARGFCAFANGGKLVEPRIVKGMLDADGNVHSRRPARSLNDLPQIIDPGAAHQIRQILTDVPIRGTAAGRKSDYWTLFGKTGTAHISQGKQGYAAARYTSSFLGGAPYESPRIVVAFIVHDPDPKVAKYGGAVSAPNACRLMERVLGYLQVPASPPLSPPPPSVAAGLYNFNPKLYQTKPENGPIASSR